MTINYIQTNDDLTKILHIFSTYKKSLLGFDIETSGLDPYTNKIHLIQFFDPYLNQAIIINFSKVSFDLIKKLFFILNQNEITLLGHNLKFDLKFIGYLFPELNWTNLLDTFIIEHIITNGLKYKDFGLDDCIKKYKNIELNKSIRKSFEDSKNNDFSSEQISYAANDVIFLLDLLEEQKKLIDFYNLEKVVKLECNAIFPTAKLELNGIFLDVNKWQKNEIYAKNNQKHIVDKLEELILEKDPNYPRALFGLNINWNSSSQVLNILKKFVDENIENTNEKTLENYLSDPIVELILEYRETQKQISSYGSNIILLRNPVTGRIHPSFNQVGTETSRYSCKEPNIQQIPKTQVEENGVKRYIYREAFVPQAKEGKLIDADYNAFELRILADLTNENKFIEGFKKNYDMHSLVASFIFGIEVSKTKNSELREIGKTINFGIAYGMGPKRLAERMTSILNKPVTIYQAGDILNKFYSYFPNIKSWQNSYIDKCLKDNRITNPYDGRILHLNNNGDITDPKILGNIKNNIKNYPCQSTNASVLKIAFTNLHNYLFKNNYNIKIVNLIHDEILLEANTEDEAKTIQPILEEIMIIAGQKNYLTKVPIKVESNINDYWKK